MPLLWPNIAPRFTEGELGFMLQWLLVVPGGDTGPINGYAGELTQNAVAAILGEDARYGYSGCNRNTGQLSVQKMARRYETGAQGALVSITFCSPQLRPKTRRIHHAILGVPVQMKPLPVGSQPSIHNRIAFL